MSTPHHSGDHHGDHPAPETDHTHHPDHARHEHHADADTHGQAMHHGHPHSVLDEDHQVHGHGEHAGHSTAMFRERFWWSLILSIPVVIFSPMVAHLLGYPLPAFPGSTWIPPVLDTIIFVYGGTPFLKGGWKEVKSRQPGMMLLIAMAITVAFVASWVTTLGLGGFDLDFWWELALLVTIMLLGHWLEMRALGGASSALDALAALLPDEAEKVIDGTTRTVDISELVVGDVVLVRAGARVPTDGTILDGAAEFDEGMITGESRPVFRDTGDRVVAGTVATDNTVRVRVEATGGDTALAGIQRMVADAQESSSRAQALADRAAALLFWFALISALITAVVWTAIGSPDDAVVRTVTVLVIACPHALGLAIPLVIAISTERAAKSGVLIKDRMALERMRTIDVVLFDKTGTLTEGAHAVRVSRQLSASPRASCWPWPPPRRPTASTPWPAPSWRPRPPIPRPLVGKSVQLVSAPPPAGGSGPLSMALRSSWAGRTCCASSTSPPRPSSPTPPAPGPGVGPVYSILSATVRLSVRWPSRTRSAPNPAPL